MMIAKTFLELKPTAEMQYQCKQYYHKRVTNPKTIFHTWQNLPKTININKLIIISFCQKITTYYITSTLYIQSVYYVVLLPFVFNNIVKFITHIYELSLLSANCWLFQYLCLLVHNCCDYIFFVIFSNVQVLLTVEPKEIKKKESSVVLNKLLSYFIIRPSIPRNWKLFSSYNPLKYWTLWHH